MSDQTAEIEGDPLDGMSPIAFIMDALADKAQGKAVDEERLEYAVCLSACATLVQKGMAVETAMQAVDSALAHGSIRIHYTAGDGLSIDIGEEGDGDEGAEQPMTEKGD